MLEQTLCEGRIAQKIRVFSLFIGKFPLPSPAKLMRRTILTRGATNKTIFTDLPQGYPPLGQFGAEGNIMSRNKLQAIHDTVTEILNEPPSSPHTYFDDEPHDAAQASEQGATASDFLQRATQIPAGGFGKATSGKPGISANEIREGDVVRDAANESSGRRVKHSRKKSVLRLRQKREGNRCSSRRANRQAFRRIGRFRAPARLVQPHLAARVRSGRGRCVASQASSWQPASGQARSSGWGHQVMLRRQFLHNPRLRFRPRVFRRS